MPLEALIGLYKVKWNRNEVYHKGNEWFCELYSDKP